jgi:hypothetical protein
MLHEGRDEFGRVLQVGVDDDRGAAGDVVEARGQREFLAEVARQPQRRHARIARAQLAHDRVGVVAAAVVDVEHGAVQIGHAVEHGADALVEFTQALALVVGGDDDGQVRHGGNAVEGDAPC